MSNYYKHTQNDYKEMQKDHKGTQWVKIDAKQLQRDTKRPQRHTKWPLKRRKTSVTSFVVVLCVFKSAGHDRMWEGWGVFCTSVPRSPLSPCPYSNQKIVFVFLLIWWICENAYLPQFHARFKCLLLYTLARVMLFNFSEHCQVLSSSFSILTGCCEFLRNCLFRAFLPTLDFEASLSLGAERGNCL